MFLQVLQYTQLAVRGRDICPRNSERYFEGLFPSQFKTIEHVRAVYLTKKDTQNLNFTNKIYALNQSDT